MATKASGNQGQVKDPEHDGRLKGHKGGEAPKAHEEGVHPDEKHAAPKKATAKKHDDEAAHDEHAAKAHAEKAPAKAKSHEDAKGAEPKKAEPAKAAPSEGDADLKAREYTDAEGNVHHHTKKYAEQHKGD